MFSASARQQKFPASNAGVVESMNAQYAQHWSFDSYCCLPAMLQAFNELQYAPQRISVPQVTGVPLKQTGKSGTDSVQPPTPGVHPPPVVDEDTVAIVPVAVELLPVPVVPVAVLEVFVELVPVVDVALLVFEVDDPCVAVVPVPVPPEPDRSLRRS